MTPTESTEAAAPTVHGFDAALAGRRAECDGGHAVAGTHFAVREEYAGTLTGEYVEEGDPPWRWYLLGELTRVPGGYPFGTVWCESGNLFLSVSGSAEPVRVKRDPSGPAPEAPGAGCRADRTAGDDVSE